MPKPNSGTIPTEGHFMQKGQDSLPGYLSAKVLKQKYLKSLFPSLDF